MSGKSLREVGRKWGEAITGIPESFRPPTFTHPARFMEVERRRRHRRATMYGVLWTTLLAGPFLGTVQGGALPVLTQVARLNDFWYGLIQAISPLAMLAQVPFAVFVDRVPNRPRAVLYLSFIGRALWPAIAAIPLILGPGAGATAAFLVAISVAWIGWHLGGLAWQSFIGDLVPARRRGTYLGLRTRLFAASNLISSVLLGLLLPKADQPYAAWIVFAIFCVASCFGVAELTAYRRAYDPPRKRPPLQVADLITPLLDRKFLPFLAFGMVIAISNGIAGPFLWRHFLNAQHMDPFHVTLILQTSALLGIFLMAGLWGRWVDRHGTKAAFIVALIGAQAFTLMWPAVTAERWGLGLAVMFCGVAFWAGVDVSMGNRLFAHGTKGGPGYFAVFNAVIALSSAGATAAGGYLAEHLATAEWVRRLGTDYAAWGLSFNHYMVLQGVCVVMRFVGLGLIIYLIPRERPVPTAVGVRAIALQMQGHLASSFAGLFLLPIRTLRQLPYLREEDGDGGDGKGPPTISGKGM